MPCPWCGKRSLPVMIEDVVPMLRGAWTHSPDGKRRRMRQWTPTPGDAGFFDRVPDPDRSVTVGDVIVPVFGTVRLTCKRNECGRITEMSIEDLDAALELVSTGSVSRA